MELYLKTILRALGFI